jgi:glutathione S-transferase
MIELHYDPGSASLAPHLLLEELGVPLELRLVDREKDRGCSARATARSTRTR